jgi:hypothetical protein
MRSELRIVGEVSASVFGDAEYVSTSDGRTIVVADWTQDEAVAVVTAVVLRMATSSRYAGCPADRMRRLNHFLTLLAACLPIGGMAAPDKTREADVIRHVTERLRRQFPELSDEQVSAAVAGRYAEFDNASIRDFLPVLVERSVRERLASQGPFVRPA